MCEMFATLAKTDGKLIKVEFFHFTVFFSASLVVQVSEVAIVLLSDNVRISTRRDVISGICPPKSVLIG